MNRRHFMYSAGSAAASLLFSASACRGRQGGESVSGQRSLKRRPNIVLILADDMGYSDIGCMGGEIPTPAIDRLAAGGMRFTRFYNSARCCPSRASLLTGLYPHQTGIGDMMRDMDLDGYRGDLNTSNVTLAEVLKTAGYATSMAGKWHVTRFLPPEGPSHNWPMQRGFDDCFAMITGAGSFFWPDTLVRGNTPIEIPDGPFYLTDAIADHTAAFIGGQCRRNPNQPFFAYVSFTAPHWPLHALEDDVARHRGRFDKGWDVLRNERYERMAAMGIIDRRWKLSLRDPQAGPWSDAPHKSWQRRRMEVYAAQMDNMDRGIGRIVAALEDCGVLEDTLIIFLSDNGGCHEELVPSWGNYFFRGRERVARLETRDGRPVRFFNDPAVMPGPEDTYQSYGYAWANLSNTPFRRFKCFTHEGGIATPCIAHWPAGIAAGGLSRHPGHIIDIMATVVDVSGARYPLEFRGRRIQPLEGRSLTPAFSGGGIERDALFFEHEGNRAVVTPSWKIVAEGPKTPWELYNMEADGTETFDTASDNPALVARLSGMWDAWAGRTGVLPWPWE